MKTNDNNIFKENLKELPPPKTAKTETKGEILKRIGENARIVLNSIKNNKEDER